jgi:predicted component of type VI protein secretion system
MPVPGFGSIRNRIQKAFLKNLLRRQGTALFGRALPFGIGAVVGGAGNLMMGRAVVANAKEAFGPMPDTIPGELKATTAAPDNLTLEGNNFGSQR